MSNGKFNRLIWQSLENVVFINEFFERYYNIGSISFYAKYHFWTQSSTPIDTISLAEQGHNIPFDIYYKIDVLAK